MPNIRVLYWGLVLGVAIAACKDSNGPPQEASSSFVGVLSNPAGETGIVRLSVPAALAAAVGPRAPIVGSPAQPAAPLPVTGTVEILGSTITLSGTFDPPTGVLQVSGGGYTLDGVYANGVLSGTYTGPSGAGAFSLSLLPSPTAPTVTFCGTFDGDAAGTWNITQSGTALAGIAVQFTGGAVFVLRGDVFATDSVRLSVADIPDMIVRGRVTPPTIQGVWADGPDDKGIWSGRTTLCPGAAGAPSTLELVSGNNQTGQPATELAQPVVVRVRDAGGAPVAGVPVTFTITSGAGSVSPATIVTDGLGLASATWALGPGLGAHTAQASVPGLGSPVSFSATAAQAPLSTIDSTITAGNTHTCVLKDGTAYCWGTNSQGQLGIGTVTGGSNVPVPVSGGLAFATLRAGGRSTCGILASPRTAHCWGDNTMGQLGVGNLVQQNSPTAVVGGFTFNTVSVGFLHSCGITESNAAVCWGDNTFGQLGRDSTTITPRPIPAPVAGGHEINGLSVGMLHSCLVTLLGTAYCWGGNDWGQLGNGTRAPGTTIVGDSVPHLVTDTLAFAQLAAGDISACGVVTVDLSYTAYCWGQNGSGSLGDGTIVVRPSPVRVSHGTLQFFTIYPSGNFGCALTTDERAYCWGYNGDGQLGDGTFSDRLTPVAVAGGLTFRALAVGGQHVCGIANSGIVYCWGKNGSGQLGDGTFTNRNVPTAVVAP